MLGVEETKKALKSWLCNCPCEVCSKEEGTYLYLTPVSLEFRSVLYFLSSLRNKSGSTAQLITRLQNIIRQDRSQYDYQNTAPILCGDCAQKAGLEINEEYQVAYPPVWVCSKCGKSWNPFQDSTRGAGLEIDGRLLCERCALAALREQDAVRVKNQNRRRKRSNRESNTIFQEEYLEGGVCEVCGSDELPILTLQKTGNSPAGTIGAWRRDCSPETFEQRIRTCRIICQKCLQKGDREE